LSKFEALVDAYLHVIGDLDVGVLEGQGDAQEVVQAVALGKEAPVFALKAKGLVGFEEGDLDSCEEGGV
jgi:hypothetical protein